jgi:hypothetical protein
VFGGEATQISPKLGNLLSRLFPDTSTPFIYIRRSILHSRKSPMKITEGKANLFTKTD